jgi:uncharacterized protein (TIGR03643 family)
MSIRLGQFGGVGGQYAPNAPGGSPNFQGGTSGYAGYGVNNFSGDISMDDLMGYYRKPDILSFERPLESLLETFHDNLEKDAEPYLLDFDERVKLNLRKKIRNKEQHLKDLATEKVKEPEAIKEKLGLSESEIIRLMRSSLKPSSFRLWRKRVSGRKAKHKMLLRGKETKFSLNKTRLNEDDDITVS